jgi:hypothetical protein
MYLHSTCLIVREMNFFSNWFKEKFCPNWNGCKPRSAQSNLFQEPNSSVEFKLVKHLANSVRRSTSLHQASTQNRWPMNSLKINPKSLTSHKTLFPITHSSLHLYHPLPKPHSNCPSSSFTFLHILVQRPKWKQQNPQEEQQKWQHLCLIIEHLRHPLKGPWNTLPLS